MHRLAVKMPKGKISKKKNHENFKRSGKMPNGKISKIEFVE